ncbi:MAG: TRAP transporter small permease [Herbaspirillum sp.]
MFARITHGMGRALEILIVIGLTIMGILVFGNVVMRYAFNSGIAISEELSRLLFVWLIFLGAILASAQHAHIGFDSLVRRLPARGKKILITLIGMLMLVASVIFIIGGWEQTVINLGNTYPVMGISYAWLYSVSLVFGVAMLFVVSFNIWNALRSSPDDTGDSDLILTQDIGDRIQEKISQVATDGNDTEAGSRP